MTKMRFNPGDSVNVSTPGGPVGGVVTDVRPKGGRLGPWEYRVRFPRGRTKWYPSKSVEWPWGSQTKPSKRKFSMGKSR